MTDGKGKNTSNDEGPKTLPASVIFGMAVRDIYSDHPGLLLIVPRNGRISDGTVEHRWC